MTTRGMHGAGDPVAKAAQAAVPLSPQPPSSAGGPHLFERHVEGVTDPHTQLGVSFLQGKLLIRVKDHIEEITLPEDAFTGQATAKYTRGTLSVTIARKDPSAPAMVEKRLLDPDGPHPRPIHIEMPGHKLPRPADSVGHGAPTPAQAAMAAHSKAEGLTGPTLAAEMAPAGLAGSVATDNPILINPGGVMEGVSEGETVVRDPSSATTTLQVPHGHATAMEDVMGRMRATRMEPGMPHPAQGASGSAAPVASHVGAGDVGSKMAAAGTGLPSAAAATVVVQGTRERALELQHATASPAYREAAAAPTSGAHAGGTAAAVTATADVGAERAQEEGGYESEEGEEYEEYEEEGVEEEGGLQSYIPDFTREKVGMATRPLAAADMYPSADDGTVKPSADFDAQVEDSVDKMSKQRQYTVGTGINQAETKRMGKPKMQRVKKSVTGGRAGGSDKRDAKIHAKPRHESHASVAARAADWAGGVEVGAAQEKPAPLPPKSHVLS